MGTYGSPRELQLVKPNWLVLPAAIVAPVTVGLLFHFLAPRHATWWADAFTKALPATQLAVIVLLAWRARPVALKIATIVLGVVAAIATYMFLWIAMMAPGP
jgi:hypothetical protein